jgi:hypothetical protein
MPKKAKVCIDRVLPTALMQFQPTARMGGGRSRAIAIKEKPWMNGSTLHVRFLGGTAAQQNLVKEQAAWWTAVANIKFEFDNSLNSEIRIAFDPNDGAWSYIGVDCRGIPSNQPTMNLGFLDGGTAAHEFGHAIGLAHEHQNPDGGIQWNEAVVLRELAGPPNNWDEETIRHNVLRKYSADQIMGTKFDPDSIMLYFFPDSWTLNGKGTKANDILSSMDKQFVAGAQMYPKTGPTPSSATNLTVNASARTKASIGAPGEEDLFRFTAKTDGRYVIDTQGSTDVVMRLFGPNNETALIAEDDDSGTGTNAKIVASLIKGDYFIQVRHYNRASGLGKYSIKVVKS